jgi:L-fucose isomerase-like protein
MKRIKIGLVGLYFPNFQAEEYKIYENSLKALSDLSEKLDFKLAAVPEKISKTEQALKAAEYFKTEDIDFLMIQASSLILGDIILPFADACERIGFWLVPEPVLQGELALNSLTGFNLGVSVLRKNYPDRLVKWFYGGPDCTDKNFQDRLTTTVSALRCLKNLNGSRIGLVHDVVPTFINLTFESESLKKNLGVDLLKIPLDEVFNRTSKLETESDKTDKVSKNIENEMVKSSTKINVPMSELTQSSRITHSLQDIAGEHNLDAVALRCWPEFQDVLKLAPCASVSYLNDHGLITSCEGDIPGAVSMLASWFISGQAPTMNDPVAMDFERNLIQMWHCGPGPVSWADENGQTLDWHHTLNRRIPEGQKKSGLSSDISFKKGAVTLIHIAGDGSTIFVMEAEVVEGPAKPFPGSGGWIGKLSSNGKIITCSDFLESITKYGLDHHYPIMRGHNENVIREFASWAGIDVLDIPKGENYVK